MVHFELVVHFDSGRYKTISLNLALQDCLSGQPDTCDFFYCLIGEPTIGSVRWGYHGQQEITAINAEVTAHEAGTVVAHNGDFVHFRKV